MGEQKVFYSSVSRYDELALVLLEHKLVAVDVGRTQSWAHQVAKRVQDSYLNPNVYQVRFVEFTENGKAIFKLLSANNIKNADLKDLLRK